MRKLFSMLWMALVALPLSAQVKPPVEPIWASGAVPTTDILAPNSAYITQGWPLSSTPPSRQYFNWLDNYLFNGIRYFSHRGIVDWDAAETYSIGDIVNGPDTYLYKSRIGSNVGNSPDHTCTMPCTFWDIPAVPTAAATDSSVRIANTQWVTSNFLSKSATIGGVNGQVQPSQLSQADITQYQNALAINWNQIQNVPIDPNPTANTIVQRTAQGHVYAVNLLMTSGIDNEPIGSVLTTNTSDNEYLRKSSIPNLQSQMPLSGFVGQVTPGQVPSSAVTQYAPQTFTYNALESASGNGYTAIPGNPSIILQWGLACGTSSSNPIDVGVTFPIRYNAVFSVVVSTHRSVAGSGQAASGSGFVSNITTSGFTATVDAGGGGNACGSWISIGI